MIQMPPPFSCRFLSASVIAILLLGGCAQSPSRVPVYKYGAEKGAGSLGIHTFRPGDTLWSVANAYHVDLRDMLDLNRLSAPYNIKAGQRIKIPAPLTYKTRKGDTLYRVSRVFDTTTTELARLNHLRSPYILSANQVLKLPSKHTNTAPVIKTIDNPPVNIAFVGTVQREVLGEVLAAPKNTTSSPVSSPVPSSVPRPVKTEAVAPVIANNQPTEIKNQVAMPLKRSSQGFLKPVAGKIISGFGTKTDGLHNDGINIKATRGDPVRASDQGVVVYSGNQIEGYGNMILIRHADGYMTAYAHMQKSLVQKGDRVSRGQTIGTVGSTGHVDTPQLHFEIRKGKEAVNPASYI